MTIPTEPQADDTDTIMAAITHGLDGNRGTGLTMLVPLLRRGPVTAAGVCAGLAECSKLNTPTPPADGFYGIVALNADGTRTSVDDFPADLRFAAQFTAAWANDEPDTAYALFDALADSGDVHQVDALLGGIRLLYDMAVASLAAARDAA